MSSFLRNSTNILRPRKLFSFSKWSSPPVHDSGWCCENLMIGAGMVIIQPSTDRVVIIFDEKTRRWFLPRGRKDMGETLQEAALREAYEESGYQVESLPLYTYQHQPPPPSNPDLYYQPNTEAIYTTTTAWSTKVNSGGEMTDPGGEYIVFWYVGQIPENAVRHEGVGMPDEQGYRSFLVTPEEAFNRLHPSEKRVVGYAWSAYQTHLHYVAHTERENSQVAQALQSTDEVDNSMAERLDSLTTLSP